MALVSLVVSLVVALLAGCATPPPPPPAPVQPAPAPPVVLERPAPPPMPPAPPPTPVESTADRLKRLNNSYLEALRQGHEADAQTAFSRLLAASLEARQLNLRLLFAAGGAEFWPDPALRRRYASWLAELARQLKASPQVCLQVVGVASASGSAATNQRIAQQRAQRVRQVLVSQVPELAPRLSTATELAPALARDSRGGAAAGSAAQSRADDPSDRRAEFRVVDCPVKP
jgi:outer membrane protein OmpA-like peptidoglycan-associated protein